jgi:hypothetical protein
MKTTNTSGAALRLFGLSIRLLSFTFGLFLAIVGAYLFLSGFVIVADQKLLPGLLDTLIGFLFISSGWRIISFRFLSHDA